MTLGRVLKRKNIKQYELQKILSEKYGLTVSVPAVNKYCQREQPSPYPCWKVVQECLRNEFGIEYRNGMWQEVITNG